MRISDWSSDVCSSDLEGKRFARRLSDGDEIFGKVESVRCDRDAKCRGRCKESIGFCWIEPNLPVNRAVCRRKFVRWATPEGAKPGLGDCAETLNQRRMFRPARDYLAVFLPGLVDRKSTRLNSSHSCASRMPSSA